MTDALWGKHVLTNAQIRLALQQTAWPEPYVDHREIRAASVLIPFFKEHGQWHLLYIRRTDTVALHKGQVAFPGGAAEEGDASPVATALRETSEEVGISPADVQVIGQMGQMLTITDFLITPVVGVIPWPYKITLQQNEVVRAFSIPLAWLSEPRNHQIRMHNLMGNEVPVIFFEHYDGELLWGITAQITIKLIQALSQAVQ